MVTDRSNKFGFMTMGSIEELKEAIRMFNGFVATLDGNIKECFYNELISKVDYHAAGHWFTTMVNSADGSSLQGFANVLVASLLREYLHYIYAMRHCLKTSIEAMCEAFGWLSPPVSNVEEVFVDRKFADGGVVSSGGSSLSVTDGCSGW